MSEKGPVINPSEPPRSQWKRDQMLFYCQFNEDGRTIAHEAAIDELERSIHFSRLYFPATIVIGLGVCLGLLLSKVLW